MIAIRRAADRTVTYGDGITTRHGFSAGAHYDPANVSFGRLIAHDLHVLAPGAGFGTHRHRSVEIVSWVLSGTLLHNDETAVRPGTVQHVSAGDGIEHSERNGGTDELRFVQMSLLGEAGKPAYRTGSVDVPGARFRVVSGAARLDEAPFVHVYVANGTAAVPGVELGVGDEARITGEAVDIEADGELLVWELR
ncbi:MAG TPA: pirin family protein [Jatrophihabitantaceae bacterium]